MFIKKSRIRIIFCAVINALLLPLSVVSEDSTLNNSDITFRTKLGSSVVRRDLERKIRDQFTAVPDSATECLQWKQDTQALVDQLQASGATASAQQFQALLDCQCQFEGPAIVDKINFLIDATLCDRVVTQSSISSNDDFIINTPGTYCLGESLALGNSIILISGSVSGVTIDLQGHTISGEEGIFIDGFVSNVEICNGVMQSGSIRADISTANTNIRVNNIIFIDSVRALAFQQVQSLSISNSLFFTADATQVSYVWDMLNCNDIAIKDCKVAFNNSSISANVGLSPNLAALVSMEGCSSVELNRVDFLQNKSFAGGTRKVGIVGIEGSKNVAIIDSNFDANTLNSDQGVFRAIGLFDTQDVMIRGCNFSNNSITDATSITSRIIDADSACSDILIDECTFGGNNLSDTLSMVNVNIIRMEAANAIISNNQFKGHSFSDYGLNSSIIGLFNINGSVVKNNFITDTFAAGRDQIFSSISVNGGQNVILGNIIENTIVSGIDNTSGLIGIGVLGTNNLVTGNTVRAGAGLGLNTGIQIVEIGNGIIKNIISEYRSGIINEPGSLSNSIVKNSVFATPFPYGFSDQTNIDLIHDFTFIPANPNIGCWTNVQSLLLNF